MAARSASGWAAIVPATLAHRNAGMHSWKATLESTRGVSGGSRPDDESFDTTAHTMSILALAAAHAPRMAGSRTPVNAAEAVADAAAGAAHAAARRAW